PEPRLQALHTGHVREQRQRDLRIELRRIGLADDVVGGIEARDVSTYRESKRSGRFRAKVGIRDEGGFVFLVEDAERRKDFACRQVENRTADGRLGDRLLDLGRVQRVDADVV